MATVVRAISLHRNVKLPAIYGNRSGVPLKRVGEHPLGRIAAYNPMYYRANYVILSHETLANQPA